MPREGISIILWISITFTNFSKRDVVTLESDVIIGSVVDFGFEDYSFVIFIPDQDLD